MAPRTYIMDRMKKSDVVTLYTKPTRSKCREANSLLSGENIEYERINYYQKPLTATKLKELLKKLKMPAMDLLRQGEPRYRELKLVERKAKMSEKELIDLMIQYPDLMQRPIIERGDRAVIGRPTEKIREIL